MQTKISNLDIFIGIQKQIFWLKNPSMRWVLSAFWSLFYSVVPLSHGESFLAGECAQDPPQFAEKALQL